jgi:hypothetical protein
LIPPEIAEILGDPPGLITEDRHADDQLMAQLALERKPRNINEWMFVRDIADISWEILRHRRAIAGVFAITFKKALAMIASDVLRTNRLDPGRLQANALAESWFEGADQREQVKSQLAKYGLDAQAIVAQTYILMADALDKLHRLLALAEARRTAVARNFHEYRAMSPVRESPVVDAEEVALVPSSA